MDELFRSTFLTVHEHIGGGVNISKHLTASPTKLTYQNERHQRRERMDALRQRALARISSSLQEQVTAKELLHIRRLESIDKCSQYYYFALRQLQSQSSGAERRMRELVFEVIGEYGKSILRTKRRHIYLRFSNRVDRIWSIFVMRWKLFVHRLIYESLRLLPDGVSPSKADLIFTSYRVLCPSRDSREVKFVSQVLSSLVSAKFILCGVVKCDLTKFVSVSSPRMGEGRGGHKTQVHSPADMVAASTEELQQLVGEFRLKMASCVSGPQGSISRSVPRGVSHARQDDSSRPGSSSADSNYLSVEHIDFLSISAIEWLRPSSYHTISEKTILGLCTSGKPSHRKHSRQNQFDCFASRYVCQHSAYSSSDFLYFCLEERCRCEVLEENGEALFLSDPTVSRRSRGLSSSGHSQRVFSVLAHLQHMYTQTGSSLAVGADEPGDFSTDIDTYGLSPQAARPHDDADAGVSGVTAKMSAEMLRSLLAEGGGGSLRVVGRLSKHREKGSRTKAANVSGLDLSELLGTYPDVLKVINIHNNAVFHFAPAVTFNLPEISAFGSRNGISSDQMRAAGASCPHPLLPLLSAAGAASPLQHLYSLCVLPLSPKSSTDAAIVARNRGDIGFAHVIMPLVHPCDLELLRHYLWRQSASTVSAPSSSSRSSRKGTADSVPKFSDMLTQVGQELYVASCLDLLPDDPTARVMHTSDRYFQPKSQQALNHSYAIISADSFENYTGMSFCDMSPLGTSSTAHRGSGFYFVQFQNSENMEMNDMLQSDLLSSDGRTSASTHRTSTGLHSDQDLMLHVLAARKEGVLGGPKNSSAARSNVSGGDLSILSSICRWRSCLSESCKEAGSKYLCRHHFNIKHFLDNGSKSKDKGVSKESAKFLPKKVSSTLSSDQGDRDLQVIRGASTLIQELWDGKLKATVSSFTHKTCVDLEVRKRLEMAMKYAARHAQGRGGVAPQQVRGRPQWSRWRDPGEIERATGLLAAARELLDMALRVERETAQEIEILASMNVYPSAEIAIIKKEVKAFREGVSTDMKDGEVGVDRESIELAYEGELSLAEKKLAIVRARRLDEEESRHLKKKKLARAKQLEESQSRDPLNFKNQSRF